MVIVRTLNLLALLGAVAWLARFPSWEALVTTIALFAAFISQESWPFSINDNDKHLFEKFLADFPSNGRSARFLKEHDIGATFQSDDLNEIDAFSTKWHNAEHEFKNKRLEKQRQKLFSSIQVFRADLSFNVFPGSRGYLTMDFKDYEDRPEKIMIRDRLNSLATKVHKDHQELVRLGKRFL